MDSVGEGEGGMIWENGIETCIISCKKQIASLGSMQDTGHFGVPYLTFLWRRKWQPTPVFLPGESHGRQSLVGCCLWGRTESDKTEVT